MYTARTTPTYVHIFHFSPPSSCFPPSLSLFLAFHVSFSAGTLAESQPNELKSAAVFLNSHDSFLGTTSRRLSRFVFLLVSWILSPTACLMDVFTDVLLLRSCVFFVLIVFLIYISCFFRQESPSTRLSSRVSGGGSARGSSRLSTCSSCPGLQRRWRACCRLEA